MKPRPEFLEHLKSMEKIFICYHCKHNEKVGHIIVNLMYTCTRICVFECELYIRVKNVFSFLSSSCNYLDEYTYRNEYGQHVLCFPKRMNHNF